ncbi:MAG: hypothetical protein M1839_006345 [Geoglossum umbratile]|nr:MAG: hypothetical protein M1839_006345 [Geoglossum umbratile]
MSTSSLPPIACLAPELLQEIDSYLSPPDKLFLRQANNAHIYNKLQAVQLPLLDGDKATYAMRTAFYGRSCQRRSGRYSQDQIFCSSCAMLRPASCFDDKTRTFDGPVPATVEEILRTGANRHCMACSLKLSPTKGTPGAYHASEIVLVEGRALTRCLSCHTLQGNILRTRIDSHDFAIFKMGCPACGACITCSSMGYHNCDPLDSAYSQSLGMLTHFREYPGIPIQPFTNDIVISVTTDYQLGVSRLRVSFCKMSGYRDELGRFRLFGNVGGVIARSPKRKRETSSRC